MIKIIFFGLGSIGKRQLRLLQDNYKFDIYAIRSGSEKVPGATEVFSWPEIEAIAPDVAFITNPTYMHIDTAIECAKRGMALFIEKPIDCSTERLDELLEIVDRKNLVSYVAYPLRFNEAITARPVCRKLIVVSNSYLPDWRQFQTYSAYKEQGGGVLLELSHEIDYVDYILNGINKIQGVAWRFGNVTVDAEDVAALQIECNSGTAGLLLSIKSEYSARWYEADGKRTQVEIKEKDYLDQLDYFFFNLNAGNKRMMNNLFDASNLFRKIIEFRGGIYENINYNLGEEGVSSAPREKH